FDLQAHAALLRAAVQCRMFRPAVLCHSSLADELVDRRHRRSFVGSRPSALGFRPSVGRRESQNVYGIVAAGWVQGFLISVTLPQPVAWRQNGLGTRHSCINRSPLPAPSGAAGAAGPAPGLATVRTPPMPADEPALRRPGASGSPCPPA